VATIHRLLATMAARGYVRQDGASHKYTLGSHLIQLGEAATRHFARFAHPYLAELMELSGETANLAVFEDGQVAYVAQVPSRHNRVRMFTEVGRRVLPHTSGVGKVVLAFRPRADVEALLVRRGERGWECYLVPIDACYELVGLVRMHWKGFDGGQEAWEAIDGFFDAVRERSRPVDRASGGPG
jgi:DNA-binding IclR family transcriptional regulator